MIKKPFDRYAPIELPPDDEKFEVIPLTSWPNPTAYCSGCGAPNGEAHYYDCVEAVQEPEDVIRKRIREAAEDRLAHGPAIPVVEGFFVVSDEDIVP